MLWVYQEAKTKSEARPREDFTNVVTFIRVSKDGGRCSYQRELKIQ